MTQYSITNVKLAAKVLSLSVSKVLSTYGPPGAAGTAKFCLLMDIFFNIMNMKNVNPHQFERKPNTDPFSSIIDPRFFWLRQVFLQYFKEWLHPIEKRQSNFSQKDWQKMFMLWKIYVGLNITVSSIIEAVQLLQHELKITNYILKYDCCSFHQKSLLVL